MIANLLPASVRVRVSGRGKDLLRLSPAAYLLKLKVPEDVVAAGQGTVRLLPSMVQYRGVGVEELAVEIDRVIEPEELSIELDRRIQRQVAVKPAVRVEIAESYVLVGGIRLEPDRVQVSGPRSKVRTIEAIPTDSLVVREVNADLERELALIAPRGFRVKIAPERVRLLLDVQELAEFDIANVPVKVLNKGSEQVQTEPSRVNVRVRGGADVIGAMDSGRDMGLYVDFREWKPGERVEVRSPAHDRFEIREIAPGWVSLVFR